MKTCYFVMECGKCVSADTVCLSENLSGDSVYMMLFLRESHVLCAVRQEHWYFWIVFGRSLVITKSYGMFGVRNY